MVESYEIEYLEYWNLDDFNNLVFKLKTYDEILKEVKSRIKDDSFNKQMNIRWNR